MRDSYTFKHKKHKKAKYAVFIYFALVFFAVLILIPFFYLITTTFKTLDEVASGKVNIIPETNGFVDNFKFVFNYEDFKFFRSFLNTMFIFLMKVVGITITCSFVGYAFAKFPCKLSKITFTALLFVMLIPGELMSIPFFQAMVNLDIRYSPIYLPMWIAAWFGIDITSIFLFKQNFASLPNELIDAAKIDGCNEFNAFFRIALPQAVPVITTVVILNFVGTYNDVYSPTLYISSSNKDLWVVAQTVGVFEGMYNKGSPDYLVPYNYVAAATIVSILPVLIFFFVAQKSFVESFVGSSIKM
jgi:multiple sugar transport system permease protein